MTTAPKLSIYSDRSWLYASAPEAVGRLFVEAPRRVIPARTRLPFGNSHMVALVEKGLMATYAGFEGEFRLITGLFGQGSILGGVKALTHAGRRMPLSLRTLCDTTVRTIDAVHFREALAADKSLENDVLSYFLVMHERQIDGLLVMEYLPLADRLAMLVETLYFAMGVFTFSMAALISLRWVLNLDISQASISPLGESDSAAMRSCTAPKILSTLCL